MLKVKELIAGYGNISVLDHVSLEVQRGEVVTIIGANGAGKTTLMKSIAGLITSRQGSIELEGVRIDRMQAEKIVSLGISLVPEGRQVFPSMTVHENLQLGAYLRFKQKKHKEIEEEFELVFNLFPVLKERLKQQAGTLSGGEQQMLAIARSLMSKPEMLLLDEPSMGLAPALISQIFKALQKLNRQGMTILLVEQDAHIALSIADRGYVLQTGRVVLEDSAKKLMENEIVKEIYFGKTI